jgi:hypothetical protein
VPQYAGRSFYQDGAEIMAPAMPKLYDAVRALSTTAMPGVAHARNGKAIHQTPRNSDMPVKQRAATISTLETDFKCDNRDP